MAGRLGVTFKLGVFAAAVLTAAGVVYYYAVYVPRRAAAIDSARTLENARAEADKRDAQRRLLAQTAAEQRQADAKTDAKTAAQARYQACLAGVGAAHDASWTAQCNQTGDKTRQDHDNCLTKLHLPKSYCDSAYVVGDDSPQCTLPAEISTVLDAALQRARTQCLKNSAAALQ